MQHGDRIALVDRVQDASRGHLFGTSTTLSLSKGQTVKLPRIGHFAMPCCQHGKPAGHPYHCRGAVGLACPLGPVPRYPGSFKAILNRLDADGWPALHLLAAERDTTLNALAIEAFNDLLKKYGKRQSVENPLLD
jgi:hypothetical protein